ncbi:STAS domain-containing protein [Negadavirga shengliensis]|jgi:anti-sigma B factor antagonist|uniref:Anti-sigma factor antagonist n=1 Tax=Negadavirga shengliensis TaxID=1389218 RepID=A0ABV9T227_9BACT
MLEINKTTDQDHIVIRLKGEVDASNSVELDVTIQNAIHDNAKKILVDGSSLEYISSAGLGVFMSYIEDFQEGGIRFVIYGLNDKVHNVFHILGLDQLIEIKENQNEALKALYEA